MNKILYITLVVFQILISNGELKLPSIFSDGMILQQQKNILVWGKSNPDALVKLNFISNDYQVKADKNGNFIFNLDPMAASFNPQSMTISSGTNSFEIDNILIGEVWLCSGQSNMQWPVKQNFDHPENYFQIKEDCNNSSIRMFNVKHAFSLVPLNTCLGSWELTSSETIGEFSSIGYFFGKELFDELNVPVGLIHSSWGGTKIESWSPINSLEKFPLVMKNIKSKLKQATIFNKEKVDADNIAALDDWKIKAKIAKDRGKIPPKKPRWKHHPVNSQHYPANLYNAMIFPIKPYTMKGAIWYQGEANTQSKEEAVLYRDLLENLTDSWREDWNDNFSFYAVQLVNYMEPVKEPVQDSVWAYMRQSFLDFHKEVDKSSIIVGIDTGDIDDIHPRNKHIIGYRLAQRALVDDYGLNKTPGGPIYRNMKIEKNKIIIEFDDIGMGLVASDAKPLQWFAISGDDKKFYSATAIIKGNKVEVSNSKITHPKAVRYAWADNPLGCNLFNRDGFPASPFRTDNW